MQKTKKTTTQKSSFPWRKVKGNWTDTCFEKKLLNNPSLMTNEELSDAVKEYLEWSRAKGKYDWKEDPILEGKEDQSPFSSEVFGRIMTEVMVRLKITGEIALGRFKRNANAK